MIGIMAWTLLIVDDEEEMCISLREIFTAEGFLTETTTNPEEAVGILQNRSIDLILMDIRMPEIGGISLLKMIRDRWSSLPIIMISGYASTQNIVQAMRYGALNFYEKPLEIPALIDEIRAYLGKQTVCPQDYREADLVSNNPVMEEVYQVVRTAAPTAAPVIITGESGTGKERIASAIHELSDRRDRSMVKINCAAIPDTLLESELFGYEAGAFTDARKARQGKFELADGGSIFFDEIGDMSLKTQAKLLRVLQEQEFERLGSNKLVRTDVRIIAATNSDIDDLIRRGVFREDLFYRISVISIHLTPLRERMEDIVQLAHYFLDVFNDRYDKRTTGFSPATKAILLSHDWPGNIRELKNVVERAVIFGQGEFIEVDDLPKQYRKQEGPPAASAPEGADHLVKMYDSLSRRAILAALETAKGSRGKAAEILNIHRKTLYNRMKKYGICGE
jgi:two-component system, NtrC family, response regulator AtoC